MHLATCVNSVHFHTPPHSYLHVPLPPQRDLISMVAATLFDVVDQEHFVLTVLWDSLLLGGRSEPYADNTEETARSSKQSVYGRNLGVRLNSVLNSMISAFSLSNRSIDTAWAESPSYKVPDPYSNSGSGVIMASARHRETDSRK